jgi:mono/diheme cytochrome c family protein
MVSPKLPNPCFAPMFRLFPVHFFRDRQPALAIALAAWALSPAAKAESGADPAGLAFFENKIRPVFAEHCYSCHSAEAKKVRGALKLDTREDFLKGGTDGAIVVAGEPGKSSLIRSVRYADEELQMPPAKDGNKKLPAAAIADLVQWVKMGAPYPATPAGRKTLAARSWSFDPITDPAVPTVQAIGWPATSVDAFILAKLEGQKVQPTPRADKRTLLRRATYDLTGLPPKPEEIDAFAADSSPEAFAKVVDRLLASPRYGERWGRHWLDVVRYADTAGDTADYPAGLAWRYRNYVIDAFNADKPYDDFLREQIAGDILAERGPQERYAERVTATGFLAISRRFGFDSEHYQHLTIQDTLDVLGQSVLGLSVGCARCHDHKFDPVSMKDYYALYGIFDSSRYAFPGSEQKGKLRAMVPLLPRAEAQPKWHDYDRQVAVLSDRLAQKKQPVPAVVFRSLHDPDGDFEIQKDASGGSYGEIVPPWLAEGKLGVTAAAQSPFKNLFPQGRFGASIAGRENEYRLAQELYPRRTAAEGALLYANLDFRTGAAEGGAKAAHRLTLGAGDNYPAIELLISPDALMARRGADLEKLADLKSREWHNLQLTLDLAKQQFAGSVSRADQSTAFAGKTFAPGWTGALDHVQLDSKARTGAALPSLEIDNFGLQGTPFSPATIKTPVRAVAPGEPDPAALTAELETLVGFDGGLEFQTDGAPPARPWHPGPNTVVKMAQTAQSPFRNLLPAGKLGITMPNRAPYDGLGLNFSAPIKATDTDILYVAFDFRTGAREAGGEGAWRFHLGHGVPLPAVELQFNATQFFNRSGAGYETVGALRPGEWHQVQLTLHLKQKTYTGAILTTTGSIPFKGTFVGGWDGVLDYAFIDSYGHRPGVRPALDADNFVFREAPFPALDAPLPAEIAGAQQARKARVEALRQQLAALGGDTAKDAQELNALLVDGPCEMTYGVVEGTAHNARVQMRGEPDRPGEEVPRGFPAALGGGPLPPGTTGSGRLELAQWVTRPDNPLVARVMVNRIWQYHFGRGLVGTPNDFGMRGQLPTHPELLDHLATRFRESGWSVKAMHRLIMLSAAYQEAAAPAAGGPPYAGFERRRLSAEEIRDSILAVSGELDFTVGQGHPFPSPISAAFSQHGPFIGVYENDRRSVYLMTQRLKRHPFLALFDGPDPNASTADRRVTTVPTQALYFLNSPFVHEKSAKFAARLQAARPDDAQRVEVAWRAALGRAPGGEERAEAAEFLAAYRAELLAAKQPEVEGGALAAYLRTLFGSNEFLHLD